MKIKDIYKKLKNDELLEETTAIDIDTNINDISFNLLKNEIIYISKNNKKIGYIKSDTIKYLQSINMTNIRDSILENVSEGVIAVDLEGRIFYVNNQYSNILGVKTSSIIGKNIRIIEKEATIIEVLDTGKAIERQNNYVKSLNKFLDVRIYPLYNDENELKGAFSIFTDVTEITELNRTVDRVSQIAENYNRQLYAEKKMKELNIIGESPNYINIILNAVNVATTDASVLILGENGTGKEILCQFIYKNSLRKENPLVTLNCSAVPENLIESELFGYEGGSFTGSSKSGKLGKFEIADKGTIFLDEIADMSLAMQAKLLRVLETGEIEKIGSQKKIKVDVRVISATNKDIESMVDKGEFREDLYYRLSVITMELPPLRNRDHDSILFLNHFLDHYNKKYNKNLIFSNKALGRIISYDWPGNIRELKNCIEHCVILCNDDEIGVEHLPKKLQLLGESNQTNTLEEIIDQTEMKVLKNSYNFFDGDIDKIAKQLNISKRTVYRKLIKYKIK